MVSVSGVDVKFGRILLLIAGAVVLIVVYNQYGSGHVEKAISETGDDSSKVSGPVAGGSPKSNQDDTPVDNQKPTTKPLESHRGMIDIDGNKCNMTYLEVVPDELDDKKPQVLLLHGSKFTASTWDTEMGTMAKLKEWGYRAVALDLKPEAELQKCTHGQPEAMGVFINKVIRNLKLKQVVLVSPSKSGEYAIPYILHDSFHEEQAGFIALAPIINTKDPDSTKLDKLPILVLRGEKDTVVLEDMLKLLLDAKKSEYKTITNGEHPWYTKQKDLWHTHLKEFLEKLQSPPA